MRLVAAMMLVGLIGLVGEGIPKPGIVANKELFESIARICSTNASVCSEFADAIKDGRISPDETLRFAKSNEKAWRILGEGIKRIEMPPIKEK